MSNDESRKVLWPQVAFALGLGAAIGMVAVGTNLVRNDPPVVRSQRFQLVDANGTLRGEWGFKGSSAEFLVYDTAGIPRIRIACDENPAIYVLKNDAGPVISLAHTKKDGAWMRLKSDDGTGVLTARTPNDVGPMLGVFKNGYAGAAMRCLEDGVSEFFLQDADMKSVWRVATPAKAEDKAK